MRRRNRLPVLLPAVVAAVGLVGLVVALFPRLPTLPDRPAVDTAGPVGAISFDTSFRAGVHLLKVGAAAEAAQLFESARERRPDQPEVYVNLGFAYLALGRYAESEAAFRRALDLHPGQINAYYGWAESLERLGDLAAARGAMRSFVHLAPEDDPFRRKAMAALWEWQADGAAAPSDPPTEPISTASFPRLSLSPLNRAAAPALPDGTGKAVVINVWATWCPPCRAELPSLQRLSDGLDPARFAVVGIAVDEDADFVREYLRDVGVRYVNYHDPGQESLREQLTITALPQTFLVRPDGSLAETIVGERAWDRPEMRSLVERLSLGTEGVNALAGAE